MQCSISGEAALEPVISLKSGHVFEKRLIEKHLKAVGTCPVTKEELTKDDLLAVQSNKAVRPRAPTATSIPGLVQVFQNEWDSLMLETFTLKQHLDTVRQELAHALYQQDAASRVIARLIKERDDARNALGNTKASVAAAVSGKAASGSAMEVDEAATGIAAQVVSVMEATAKKLSKERKKRVKALGQQVASKDAVAAYTNTSKHPLHGASKPGITALAVHSDQKHILTGGVEGNAIVFNKQTGKVEATLKGHKKKITDVKFHPTENIVFTTSADSTGAIWAKKGNKYSQSSVLTGHTGSVVGCTVHPSGNYVVTAGADNSWAFWDVETGSLRQQVQEAKSKKGGGYSSVSFHPDGLILGAGTSDSTVRIFDVKQQKNVATFKGHSGDVVGLSFSENGYYLASSDTKGTVKLWDLRKLSNFHTISDLEGSAVKGLAFDGSGSYLGVGGKDLRVYGTKKWEQIVKYAEFKDEVTSVQFGANASFIAATGGPKDRNLKIFS